MSKKLKASLMGGTGYAAAELIRRLQNHPDVELVKVASIDNVGDNVGKIHKSFRHHLPFTLEDLSPEEVAKDVDVVFLALPHKVSYLKVPELLKTGKKIVDYSGDYRIQDVDSYNHYYKTQHTNPENISKFVYGLPELNRDKIREAQNVSNPGCFPTGVGISFLPLAKNGLLRGKVRVVAPTGSSGSGVAPSIGTHHPTRSRNLKSYKPLVHQHQPEMEQTLKLAGGKDIFVDFIPISAPLTRGMLTNSLIDLPADITEKDIQNMYQEYFKDHPFIRLMGSKELPEVAAIAGTNYVELGWSLKEAQNGTKTFAVIAAYDNLVKGATGQAIQNMNLMFGLNETAGINDLAYWP